MKPYELTYIIASSVKSDDAETLKKEVEVFVQDKGGVIVKSEKTAPQSLAYPIKKHSSGYFVTVEFQLEEKEIKGLKEKLEKEKNILRHALMIKRPVKEMKVRRTRKPAMVTGMDKPFLGSTPEDKGKKVALEDVEKKLEEILSE